MTQGKLLKKNFEERGITLIALVITIVVLLILAVVAIQAVTSDGIIIKAKEAREASQLAEEIEKVNLAISEAKINPNYELTLESLSQTIQKYFGADATVEGGPEQGYYLVTIKGKNTYKIDLSGKILEQPGENAGGDTDGDDEGEEVLANTLVIEGYEDGIISFESTGIIYPKVKNKSTGNFVPASELEVSSTNANISIIPYRSGSDDEFEITIMAWEKGSAELTIQHKTDKSLFAKVTVYAGAPSSITISGYTNVNQGSSISLTALDKGSVIPANEIEWISENTEIATVTGLSTVANVTGVSAGTVKIIAKSKINTNIVGETTITVNGVYTSPVVGPTEINISGPATGKVGESIYLSVNDGSGNMMYPDDITVTSYSAVRITKGSGCIWVTSSVPGSSIPITVTLNSNPSVSKIHYITFSAVGPTQINISGPTSGTVGQEVVLPVTDENGNPLFEGDVTATANSSVSIRYASGNVIVSSSMTGEIPITVRSKSDSSVYAVHYINFSAAAPTSLTIQSYQSTISVGNGATLYLTDQNGNYIFGEDLFTWQCLTDNAFITTSGSAVLVYLYSNATSGSIVKVRVTSVQNPNVYDEVTFTIN